MSERFVAGTGKRITVLVVLCALGGCVVSESAALQRTPLEPERVVDSTETQTEICLGEVDAESFSLRVARIETERVRVRSRTEVSRATYGYAPLNDLLFEPIAGLVSAVFLGVSLCVTDLAPSPCEAGHPGEEHRFALAERVGYWLTPGLQVRADANRGPVKTTVALGHWQHLSESVARPAPAGTQTKIGSLSRRVGPAGEVSVAFAALAADLPPGYTRELFATCGEARLRLLVTSPHPIANRWSVSVGNAPLPPPVDDLLEPNDDHQHAAPLRAPALGSTWRSDDLVLRAGDSDWFRLRGGPCLRRYAVRLRSQDPHLGLLTPSTQQGGAAPCRELVLDREGAESRVCFGVTGGARRATYELEVQDLGSLEDDAFEPNDSPAEAALLPAGRYSLRALGSDWFEARIPPLSRASLRLTYRGASPSALGAGVVAQIGDQRVTLEADPGGKLWLDLPGFAVSQRVLRLGVELGADPAPYELELEVHPLTAASVLKQAQVCRAAGRFARAAGLYLSLRERSLPGAPPAAERTAWTLSAARSLLHAGEFKRAGGLLTALARSPDASPAQREAALRRLSQLRAGRQEPRCVEGLLEAEGLVERGLLTKDPGPIRAALRRLAHLEEPRSSVLRALLQALEREAAQGLTGRR